MINNLASCGHQKKKQAKMEEHVKEWMSDVVMWCDRRNYSFLAWRSVMLGVATIFDLDCSGRLRPFFHYPFSSFIDQSVQPSVYQVCQFVYLFLCQCISYSSSSYISPFSTDAAACTAHVFLIFIRLLFHFLFIHILVLSGCLAIHPSLLSSVFPLSFSVCYVVLSIVYSTEMSIRYNKMSRRTILLLNLHIKMPPIVYGLSKLLFNEYQYVH